MVAYRRDESPEAWLLKPQAVAFAVLATEPKPPAVVPAPVALEFAPNAEAVAHGRRCWRRRGGGAVGVARVARRSGIIAVGVAARAGRGGVVAKGVA